MRVCFLFALLGLARSALAAEDLLAVFPVDVSRDAAKRLSSDGAEAFAQLVRDEATGALGAAGWSVLPESETTVLARKAAARCAKGACHADLARRARARAFVSGVVTWDDGLVASVRLVEAASGRVLAAATYEAPASKELRKAFKDDAPAFFAKSGLLPAAPPPGGLVVSGTPDGAAWELTGPGSFREEGTLPMEAERLAEGWYRIVVKSPPFEEFSARVQVSPGQVSRLQVALRKAAPAGPASSAAACTQANRDALADASLVAANELIKAGNLKGGIAKIEELLSLDPSVPFQCKAWRNLGVAHARAGANDEAVKSYRTFLKLCPDTPERDQILQLFRP